MRFDRSARGRFKSPVFSIHEWQIWHGYTTYFAQDLPPLKRIARDLVRFNVAEAAVTSSGDAWWSQDDPNTRPRRADRRANELGYAALQLESPYSSHRATLPMPPGLKGFPGQCVYEWAWRAWGEGFLLGASRLLPEYVTAYLGVCTLMSRAGHRVNLYPVLRIYETGVASVQFRVFGNQTVELESFVSEYVNAPLHEFSHAFVPPGLAAWTPQAFPEEKENQWARLPYSAFIAWYHQREVARRSWVHNGGDFQFRQVSLGLAKEQQALEEALASAKDEARTAALTGASEKARELGLSDHLVTSLATGTAAASRNPADGERSAQELRTHEGALLGAAEEAAKRVAVRVGEEVALAGAGPETVHGLALTIIGVAGVVAASPQGPPRSGFGAAALGRRPINPLGNHWTGRPHVHLIRFAGQRVRASQNEAAFAREFGAIMARHVPADRELARQFLPKSPRWADDFAIYLSSAITLWVHSRSSLDRTREEAPVDPNRDRLVHLNQVKAEVLEYGYALHRRVAERAQHAGVGSEGLLEAERELADFEWSLQDAGRFGEIRELLRVGFEAFGVPQLRGRIEELVSVRRSLVAERSARVSERWTSAVAVIVGMLAVPTIAESFLTPAWNAIGLGKPETEEGFQLLMVSIALLGTAGLLWLAHIWARRRRRERTP